MAKKSEMSVKDPSIPHYEVFFKAMGFKRTDGSIFGLLVLSPNALSSEEIGKTLGLSQGAVSQGLKSLGLWGAVRSQYSSARRIQLHSAVEDSLSIVATIFQKRESGAIEAFRRANEQAKVRFMREGDSEDSLRIQRLNSYITTCEFAQVIMEFAMGLSKNAFIHNQYSRIIRTLPKALGSITKGSKILGGIRNQIVERVSDRSQWL